MLKSVFKFTYFLFQARNSSVPINVVKSLVQFYLRKQRAREEIVIVEEEMRSTLCYWKNQLNTLTECFSNQTSVGIRYLLRERVLIVENFLENLQKLFRFAIEPVTAVETSSEVATSSNTDNLITLDCSDDDKDLFSDDDFSSDEEEMTSSDDSYSDTDK